MATAVRVRGADRVALAYAAAGLSFAAACVHGSVMVTHFREYWLFGLFFAIVTPLQILWAELVRRRPENRRLLLVGGVASASIALIWLVSRTVGLPFGPEQLQAEAVGPKDLLATWDELFLASLVAVLLLRPGPHPAPRWAPAVAWVLVAVSLVAALVAGSH